MFESAQTNRNNDKKNALKMFEASQIVKKSNTLFPSVAVGKKSGINKH